MALSLKRFRDKLGESWETESFVKCVREVYQSPSSEMRSAVVEVAAAHVHSLVNSKLFKDLVSEGGEFVVDYFAQLHQMPVGFYWLLYGNIKYQV